MNISPRDRNIIIGAVAAVVAVGILAFFIGRSSNGEEAATTTTTPTATQTVPTAPTTPARTTTQPVTGTQTQPAATIPAPSPQPQPELAAIELIDAAAYPLVVSPGQEVTYIAILKGDAVYVSAAGPYLSAYVPLMKESAEGDISRWSVTMVTPNVPGALKRSLIATDSATRQMHVTDVPGWTVEIVP